MAEILTFLAIGFGIGLVLNECKRRRDLANLDEETKFRRTFYEHCKSQPVSPVTTAPGLRILK
jgi:hypothetical protein